MWRAGVVVFAAIFAFASACSSSSGDSAFPGNAGAADASSCKLSPTSSIGDCPCGSLTDFCANGACPMTLAAAEDASAWASAGPQPNCSILQSTSACSGQIEVAQRGDVDTSETFFYDQTSGGLTGVDRVSNLNESCGGTIPAGDCGDKSTLEPLFGVLDGGVCYGNTHIVDAGTSDE